MKFAISTHLLNDYKFTIKYHHFIINLSSMRIANPIRLMSVGLINFKIITYRLSTCRRI